MWFGDIMRWSIMSIMSKMFGVYNMESFLSHVFDLIVICEQKFYLRCVFTAHHSLFNQNIISFIISNYVNDDIDPL